MDEGIKKLQDELGELTSKLRSNLEKADSGSAIVKKSVDKISDRMDEVEKGIKKRLDLMETKAKRTDQGGAEGEVKEKARKYNDAFDSYLRKGLQGMAPDQVELVTKSLTTDSDPDGGFAMPENFSARFIETLVEVSPIRSLCTVESISQGNSLQIMGDDSTAWGSGWLSERKNPTETTTGQLRMEEIPTHEQYAEPQISRSALSDPSTNLEAWMNRKVAERFAVVENQGFLSGTGVGQPEGILTVSGLTEVNSGSAAALTADGIINLAFGLKTFYARNSTFVLNRTSIRDIRKLKDSQNQYLWQPGLAGSVPSTILDRPYVEAPDMPTIAANSFPILFGDLRAAYTIVDRAGINVLRDPFTSKGFVKFFTTRRVGGQVVLKEAIIKHKVSV